MIKWEHVVQTKKYRRLVTPTCWLHLLSPASTDISECASNPCQNGGTCVEGVNQYKCTCLQNWSGSHCQHQTQTGQEHSTDDVWVSLVCPYVLSFCHVSNLTFIFSPLMQRPLSGASWTTQRSPGDLTVPKWTKPNTAAAMRAFTWVAPLTTVSVRVSCNYELT